jgi:DNA-binding transcriptional MerR regulator
MGLLPEVRWSSGGHRLFGEDVFERLEMISQMKSDNKSLRDIREYFEQQDSRQSVSP